MDAETQAYVDALHNLWEHAREAIRDLPAAALDWRPLEQNTNPVAVIVTHMCGSAALGVYQAVTGVDVHRQRDAEFRATTGSAEELLALVDRTEAQARSALEQAAGSLSDMVTLPGREPTPRRASVLRSMGHLGEHVGHLQLTRQLWAARK